MNKFIKAQAFFKHLFDQERLASQAAVIVEAILAACSPRLSAIAQHMPGNEAANYKAIQRFLAQVDVKALLPRLFQADAPFVIGDPTEMPRPQARKTSYVGKLKDGKTRGFWLLLLATPFRGRAIPCGFVTYSSKTIAQMQRSRNPYHWAAFDHIKALLGDKPLVLDREFSYLELLVYLVQVSVNFVIRLNMGSHAPTFSDAAGRKVILTVGLGEQVVYHQLRYMGQVLVNVVGVWRKGCAEPLWVMSNLPPERALTIYSARMKIEEAFRDLKNLLNLDKVMNKSQQHMEQMAALVMLAFTIGFLSGEAVRDELYGAAPASQTAATAAPAAAETAQTKARRKWQLYSGLFIVLKRKISLSNKRLRQLQKQVVSAFAELVQPLPVRT
jgi:Transposase DDE domain